MLLENRTYPGDVRVRREAESLAGAGYGATVVAPRGPGSGPRVLAPNESHRAVALERGGVAPARVAVVRNWAAGAHRARRGDGRPGPLRDPHLIFLGSMESQDGVDVLPALMRVLAERSQSTPDAVSCRS
jgi:hypothetical protein